MFDSLITFFKSLAPFTDEELDVALKFFKEKRLQKNDFFLKKGHFSEHVGFVQSGLLRSFYEIKGKEKTTFFAIPGSIAFDNRSFSQRVPAVESIQAIEPSILLLISRRDLYDLYEGDWKWQQVGRLLYERYFLLFEERAINLQNKNAQELYELFLVNYPMVAQKAPLSYIASYLGMTPETLSRIRKLK